MLALAAALATLVLAQTPMEPEEGLPPDMIPAEPAPEPVPEQRPPSRGRDAWDRSAAPLEAPAEVDGRPRQLSLLSAEPLGGGSATLAWAGWSSIGVMYGQGITRRDDLGASVDFDWSKTELRLGAFYRRPLGTAGPFQMAGRLGLGWLLNMGAGWIHDENTRDRGPEVAPGLSLSARGAGGIFSILGELPLAVTVKHDSGLLFVPRVSVAYETPLYDELTVGVRAGAAYRAGSGDAPLRDGMGELQFLVLAGYQIL
jgi:hypothetical protein